jgi:ATP-binding cassette subfamily B protein
MKRAYLLIKPWIFQFLIAILLLLINVIIRTIEPKILQTAIEFLQFNKIDQNDKIILFISNLLPNSSANELSKIMLQLGLLFLIMALMRSIMGLTSKAISINASESAIYSLRTRLFLHIQKLPIPTFDNLNKGEIIQRLSGDLETVKNFLSGQSVEFIRLIFTASIASYMLFNIYTPFALICLSLSPIILIVSIVFFRYETKIWEKHEEEADKLTQIVQENFNGIKSIQAYNKQKSEKEKFDDQNFNKLEIGLKHNKLHTFFWPSMDFVTLCQTGIIIIAGGFFVYKGKMTIAQLAAAFSYAGMISWPLKMIGRVSSQMGMAFVALDRIFEIIELPQEKEVGIKNIDLNGDIVFKNINFRYPKNEIESLKNIDFEIPKGRKVALVGQFSSGKTTIIKLLMRFYEPSKGSIIINNHLISEINPQYLRSRIAYVTQQPYLFSMGIGENIKYNNPVLEDEAINHIIKISGFPNFNEIFNNGFDTAVGEKGVSLSGGQKQRISLARALSKDFDILILDDFTSALDKKTEKNVLKDVFEYVKGKTSILVTHRIETMKQCDLIIVLNNDGSIENIGNPDSLWNTSPYLIQLQNSLKID